MYWKLTTGAALQGVSTPACGLAEDRGLEAVDSTNMGRLMCVDPRRGLPRVPLDRNNGFDCPEFDWRHLGTNTHGRSNGPDGHDYVAECTNIVIKQ